MTDKEILTICFLTVFRFMVWLFAFFSLIAGALGVIYTGYVIKDWRQRGRTR